MRVVTAYSHKGGTGKTTSLMMLASAIDAANQSALLIDCDPHQSFKAYQTSSLQAGPDRWCSRFETRFLHYETTPLSLKSVDAAAGATPIAFAAPEN